MGSPGSPDLVRAGPCSCCLSCMPRVWDTRNSGIYARKVKGFGEEMNLRLLIISLGNLVGEADFPGEAGDSGTYGHSKWRINGVRVGCWNRRRAVRHLLVISLSI